MEQQHNQPLPGAASQQDPDHTSFSRDEELEELKIHRFNSLRSRRLDDSESNAWSDENETEWGGPTTAPCQLSNEEAAAYW